MSRRHLYVPHHCVVLNVLATFAISIVRVFMDPEVGCPTIFVKLDSPKAAFTIEVIDAVVSLGIFLYFAFERGLLDRLSYFAQGLLDWLSSFSGGDIVGQTWKDGRYRVNDCVQHPACLSVVSAATPLPRCRGVGSLNRVIGDSDVVLCSWFRIGSFGRVSGNSDAALWGDRIS